MSDMNAVFPSSFELWEFVSAFEDGSLPAEMWNDRALAVVAIWYLYLLPPGDAMERLEAGLQRNRLQLRRVPGSRADSGDSLAEVWPVVLRHVLESFGERNPVAAANRLMDRTCLPGQRHRAA